MALPKHLKLDVRLLNTVDGQPLPTVLDSRTRRTYSVAKAGQKFLVEVKLFGARISHELHAHCDVDGHSIHKALSFKSAPEKQQVLHSFVYSLVAILSG
jgi:hypothetical protein